MSANGARLINTGTLQITGAGTLDLANNDMIVSAGVLGTWNGSGYTGIQGLVKQGKLVTSQTAALATRGRTTILISHRFSTVRLADRICVLERGRVVELGTHDELMALGGRYRTMFDLQAQRFTDAHGGLTSDGEALG